MRLLICAYYISNTEGIGSLIKVFTSLSNVIKLCYMIEGRGEGKFERNYNRSIFILYNGINIRQSIGRDIHFIYKLLYIKLVI